MRIINIAIIISLVIASLIMIKMAFYKVDKIIKYKDTQISELNSRILELQYKILSCRLNTINELKGEPNDQKGTDSSINGQKD